MALITPGCGSLSAARIAYPDVGQTTPLHPTTTAADTYQLQWPDQKGLTQATLGLGLGLALLFGMAKMRLHVPLQGQAPMDEDSGISGYRRGSVGRGSNQARIERLGLHGGVAGLTDQTIPVDVPIEGAYDALGLLELLIEDANEGVDKETAIGHDVTPPQAFDDGAPPEEGASILERDGLDLDPVGQTNSTGECSGDSDGEMARVLAAAINLKDGLVNSATNTLDTTGLAFAKDLTAVAQDQHMGDILVDGMAAAVKNILTAGLGTLPAATGTPVGAIVAEGFLSVLQREVGTCIDTVTTDTKASIAGGGNPDPAIAGVIASQMGAAFNRGCTAALDYVSNGENINDAKEAEAYFRNLFGNPDLFAQQLQQELALAVYRSTASATGPITTSGAEGSSVDLAGAKFVLDLLLGGRQADQLITVKIPPGITGGLLETLATTPGFLASSAFVRLNFVEMYTALPDHEVDLGTGTANLKGGEPTQFSYVPKTIVVTALGANHPGVTTYPASPDEWSRGVDEDSDNLEKWVGIIRETLTCLALRVVNKTQAGQKTLRQLSDEGVKVTGLPA